jgi:hypothetical protein
MAFISLSDEPAFFLSRWMFESLLEDAIRAAGQSRPMIVETLTTGIDVSGLSLEIAPPEIAAQCVSVLRSTIEDALKDSSETLAAKRLDDASRILYTDTLRELQRFLDSTDNQS